MLFKTCVFIFLFGKITSNPEPCRTHNGQNGNCVPFDQCPTLRNGLPKNPKILRSLHCGFSGSQPKLCCPNSHEKLPPSNLLPDPNSCGLHTSDKIVGGQKAQIDEFPWMALLKFQLADGRQTFECGGSLINKRYVLTAAHCLLPQLIGVRLGEYNTETDPDCVFNSFGSDCASKVLDFGIEDKIRHDNYDPHDGSQYNDIGLIRLDRDVEYSDFIQPICLPVDVKEMHNSYTGKHLTVSGWGLTEKGVKSSIKLKVQVPVRDLHECESNYRKLNISLTLDVGQICAGGVKGRDSCSADSGGPLMSVKFDKYRDPHFYAIGVVSYGPNPCGQDNMPAVYTKVSKYASWIVGKLRP